MSRRDCTPVFLTVLLLGMLNGETSAGKNWPQLQGNAQRSGDVADEALSETLGLAASFALSDGIYASPVVSDGTVYVIDGSGTVFAFNVDSLKVKWKFATKGGPGNCNNVAAPAVVGSYLHVGTTAGYYYVLDLETGSVVKQIDLQEPVFSAPAVGKDRVYVATLGARVFALQPDGTVVWTWDFVKEVVDFAGNRWSGADWLAHRKDRVTWRDHFVCSRDICLVGNTVVMPAGGRTVFIEDTGDSPALRNVGIIPAYAGSEYPATFGQSADSNGNVYVQWHRRDNAGRVEKLRLDGNELTTDFVKGTETSIRIPGLLSFSSVSIRNGDVYRVRPEQGKGLCRHLPENAEPEVLSPAGAICPPVLTKQHAVYGGLDGNLYVVTLGKGSMIRSLATGFGAPISAPVAVADGRVFVGSEDGYLYIFAKDGDAKLPTQDLNVWKVRNSLTGPMADGKFDWYTNYGDFSGTNANDQGLTTPLRMRWARRLEGTVKHLPVCGGGRLYTHTAEGQIIAVEQDTGRILWRRYWPDVYLSFTSTLYLNEKLLVPQAGIRQSRMRCLDAATGQLLWEAPFTGSPSWSRQFPPVAHGNIAIYASGTGEYAAQGSEKPFTFGGTPVDFGGREVMSFIYSNDNPFYPKDHRPRLWAWELDTGKVVWEKDFSEYGRGGNDCGICMLDGKLYYSTFFGYASSQRKRRGLPEENNGLTACLDPATGDVVWLTTKYYLTSKCTLSSRDGRIYIGGYNRAKEGTDERFVWCLDAKDGSLVWQSDAVTSALNVVTVGERFIFSNALRGKGNVFDRESGKIVSSIGHNYACCRFTLSEPFVLGANMDMIDLSKNGELVSTGPAIDSRECLGAVVSNGRIFYTSQASGFVVSQTYGEASKSLPAVWERQPAD
ncbi:MAG: PQQ-binding-like beta-propeller repeat protein [Planctomycetota bacterium]|nr:PQQ-binding-like beta-propeller repeat protein [Planctomycetota bacterium]MDA0920849.1 PQQ-binding-like beta-propeller repeat protein [Planctomycetota bacterium]